MKYKKTVYAVVLFVNPHWGLRSERNRLEFKELKMFTTEKSLFDYLEGHGFTRTTKDQCNDGSSKAVEIRKRTV